MTDRWRVIAVSVIGVVAAAGVAAVALRPDGTAHVASGPPTATPTTGPRPSPAAPGPSTTGSPAARPSPVRTTTTPPHATASPTALPADALLVGPGHRYARPCQAIAAARPGATIGIDARGNGTYDGDVCAWSTDGLTITGYNGVAHIDAAGHDAQGKAIWVISGDHTTVRDVELSGATVPDRNGAGIRQEGAGLTVVGCYFHDNQDGILAGDNPASDIVVRDTQFSRNGAGDGFSHNLYVNHVRSFTLEGSWSHDANVGHLVKSRALTNYILYNRITGQAGSDSYEIDLPNGGLSYVIGNVIQQGANSQNSAMLTYGEEGDLNPDSSLYVVGNTFVNDLGRGVPVTVGASVTAPATVVDNVSVGSATLIGQPRAVLRGNCVTSDPSFVAPSRYDYRLAAGSPCVDSGVAPGSGHGYPLTPTRQYAHPTSTRTRPHLGQIDAGAFESG